MPSRSYVRGRRAEYEAMEHLVMQGFQVARMAGSHGPFDLVAIGPQTVKLVQVKSGELDAFELRRARERLAPIPAPACVVKELWLRVRGGWQIEVLNGP